MAEKPEPTRAPHLAMATGLFLLLAHVSLARATDAPFVREMTLLAGTAFVLVAIKRRLQTAEWDFPARAETAAFIAVSASAAAGLAAAGLPEHWGAARLLYGGVGLFAFGATVLVLLPPTPRKVLLSLWIVFHFGGLFTTFSSIDPPGVQGPFLSKQAWTFIYRPYLSYLYLTNAYHFYSPNPGPPSLLWFAVKYSDGSHIWVRVPSREKGQIGMHYQRLLALPEHSFSSAPRAPLTRAEVAGLARDQFNEDRVWENIYERRILGSGRAYAGRGRNIPLPADLEVNLQYMEPNDTSKMMLASVARRAFQTAPVRPGLEVRSVKMYRVTHQLLSMYEVSKGISPFQKQKFWPYFMGEFNADGELVDPLDPFLYWYLPIVRVPSAYPNHGFKEPKYGVPMLAMRVAAPEPNYELDGLELHAAGAAVKEKP